jgi:hypothetical protein
MMSKKKLQDPGIGISLVRADGSTQDLAHFAIESMPYYDIVFKERTPITMYPGDSLAITANFEVYSHVDGVKTGSILERWAYTVTVTAKTTVGMIRLVKVGEEAWIIPIDELPVPKIDGAAWKATRVGLEVV